MQKLSRHLDYYPISDDRMEEARLLALIDTIRPKIGHLSLETSVLPVEVHTGAEIIPLARTMLGTTVEQPVPLKRAS